MRTTEDKRMREGKQHEHAKPTKEGQAAAGQRQRGTHKEKGKRGQQKDKTTTGAGGVQRLAPRPMNQHLYNKRAIEELDEARWHGLTLWPGSLTREPCKNKHNASRTHAVMV